ncbi:MAG: transcriptional regulator [Pseudanabaena sp. M046S1SP1A06QC]|nr:transcriptional regulator [Pseudanabaena sp. M046S1SP1A06QC]
MKQSIKTESEYDRVLEKIALLMNAKASTSEANELEMLAILVEVYEDKHYPINPPTQLASIQFRQSNE